MEVLGLIIITVLWWVRSAMSNCFWSEDEEYRLYYNTHYWASSIIGRYLDASDGSGEDGHNPIGKLVVEKWY